MLGALLTPTRWLGIPDIVTVVIVLAVVLYIYGTSNHNHFVSRNIPGPKPLPLIGHAHELMSIGMNGQDDKYFKKYGPVYGVFSGASPVMVVADPELIRLIGIKEFSNFVNRSFVDMLPISKYLMKSVSILKDDQWKGVRNVITPTFSGSKMKLLTPIIEESAKKWVGQLVEQAKRGPSDEVKGSCGFYSMDVVACALFGVHIESGRDKNNPFVHHAKQLFEVQRPIMLSMMLIFPFLCRLARYFEIDVGTFGSDENMKFFADHVEEFMKQRGTPGYQKRVDFLALLMEAHKNEAADHKEADKKVSALDDTPEIKDWRVGKRQLTHEEIIANAIIFIVAGYETTATAMTWTFYCLSKNQEAQEKLYEEIMANLDSNDSITYDKVASMTYLDACFNEAIRIYPPAIRFDRVCSKECDVMGYHFEQGATVQMSIWGLQRNADYWPEPLEYKPERFLPENKDKIVPYTFLPFGVGPRNCVGQRLAYLEAKIGILHAVRQIKFSPDGRMKEPIEYKNGANGLLAAKDGVWVTMEAR